MLHPLTLVTSSVLSVCVEDMSKAPYPSKKTILMRDHDIYSSEDKSASNNVSKDSESQTNEDAHACEGELLMICGNLNNQSIPQLKS